MEMKDKDEIMGDRGQKVSDELVGLKKRQN